MLRSSAKGKSCFIVATGPSLTIRDIEKLEGITTFGVNGIFLLYQSTKWRPTYYVCTDAPYFRKMFYEYNINIDSLSENSMFFNSDSKKLIGQSEKSYFIPFSRWNRSTNFEQIRFSDNLITGLYAFGTVTNIAITIAMYMGYERIYIIGADCSNLNRHVVNDVTDAEKSDQTADNIVLTQIKGYKAIKNIADERNIKIYNATRGGALEIFPRITLEQALKNENKSNQEALV